MILDHYLPDDAVQSAVDRSRSIDERLRQAVARHVRAGTLFFGVGAVALVRALTALRRSPKRAAGRLVLGALWIGIGVLQRRSARGVAPSRSADEPPVSETKPVDGMGMPADGDGDVDVTPEVGMPGIDLDRTAEEPSDEPDRPTDDERPDMVGGGESMAADDSPTEELDDTSTDAEDHPADGSEPERASRTADIDDEELPE